MRATLMLFFLSPLFASAQIKTFQHDAFKKPVSHSIPEKAHYIKIGNKSFLEICNALLDAGYEIERKDNELGTVQSKSLEYPCFGGACKTDIISIRMKGDTAFIKGRVYISYNGWQEGYYLSKKGLPKKDVNTMAFLNAYLFANKIADQLSFE